ncbi:MAG: proteasome assembly chaperone family protein [Thermoplasmata archaeon]
MDSIEARVIELDKYEVKNPLVILGFVEMTTLGLLTTSYIIEQKGLHQIAQVKSVHIPPVAVFIGGKLRSPFRIYASKDGSLMVITCEVPVDDEGLYEISSVLLKWLENITPREIVIIDGIPVKGFLEQRDVYAAAPSKILEYLSKFGVKNAESAIISGLGGALINESLGKKIDALTLMTPSSVDIPDPQAVLSIIDILNKAYGLNVETAILEESVKKLQEQEKAVIDKYNQLQKEKSQKVPEQSIYG